MIRFTAIPAIFLSFYCHFSALSAETAPAAPFDLAAATERAAKGDAEAQYAVGRAYMKGEGAPVDPAQAVSYFKKAAAQGHAKAQANLGALLINGKGVPVDLVAGKAWLEKSAAQGDAVAQTSLGWLYYAGIGTNKNIEEGVRWYRKAADAGQIDAQLRLGDHYMNSKVIEGAPTDFKEAAKYLTMAAATGHAGAQNSLGVLYEEGKGVEKNLPEAVRLFRAAAEQGEPRGQMNLGRLYDEGKGVEHNPTEAAYWLALSVRQEEITAQRLIKDLVASNRIPADTYTQARRRADQAATQNPSLAPKPAAKP